jgi:hypothetical protein
MTGVTRYAALWCPDFPPTDKVSDKAACFEGAKIVIFIYTTTIAQKAK